MKLNKRTIILYIIALASLSFFALKTCKKVIDDTYEIELPEKKGSLVDNMPEESIRDSIFIYKIRDTIVKYNNPIDTVFITKYITASEPEREKMFLDAVQNRTYKNSVEDDTLKITYTATTQGYLKDIKFDYTVKPQYISVPVKRKTQFLGGFGLEATRHINDVTPRAILGVRDKKGRIYTVGYGRNLHGQESWSVGFMTPLFN